MMHLSNMYGLLWCWMLLQDHLFSPCNCRPCQNSCLTCDSENHCHQCKYGFWGEACNETCKSYCKNNTCSRYSGLCDSCEDGRFLSIDRFCSLCSSNCLVCAAEKFCTKCITGYRGDRCQQRCLNCKPETTCDITTGHCDTCRDGLSGSSCDIKCNSKCKSCNRFVEDSCDSCSHDRYGEECNYECPDYCLDGTCNKIDGSCTLGCSTGYWGKMCNYTCDASCQDSPCNSLDGRCAPKQKYPNYVLTWVYAAIAVVVLAVVVAVGVCYGIRRLKSFKRPFERSIENGSLIHTNAVYIKESSEDDPEYETVDSTTVDTLHYGIPEGTCRLATEVPFPDDPPKKGSVAAPLQGYGKRLDAYYINGFNRKGAYIACKDPKSLDDKIEFWKMIWDESCNIIVMLTGPQEDAGCSMYWTEVTKTGKCLFYDDICVTTVGFTLFEGINCRTIEVQKTLDKRTVIQIQWQYSCTPNIENLCLFRELVLKHTVTGQCVPLLIHSSDGVSRCGLYMALDIFLKTRESGYFKPIAACIRHLRKQKSALLRHNEEKQILKNAEKIKYQLKGNNR